MTIFTDTTLYFYFSTLAQVLAAIVALIAVIIHFRISSLRDILIGDGKAILISVEKRINGISKPKPFDVVLHDPFSPESNPAGWTPELFKKIAAHSLPDVRLSTYSAASSARAAMAVAGWFVARYPGAPGKREMTEAFLSESPLQSLKKVNELRLAERWRAGDFE